MLLGASLESGPRMQPAPALIVRSRMLRGLVRRTQAHRLGGLLCGPLESHGDAPEDRLTELEDPAPEAHERCRDLVHHLTGTGSCGCGCGCGRRPPQGPPAPRARLLVPGPPASPARPRGPPPPRAWPPPPPPRPPPTPVPPAAPPGGAAPAGARWWP